MVESAFGAFLVSPVGLASLLAPAFLAASVTTICVPTVTPGAYKEQCPALIGPTEPLS